ncbi:efflux RND transporter permease subunit, partial [Salmonella enterica subsp. enterica serovar Infantis]
FFGVTTGAFYRLFFFTFVWEMVLSVVVAIIMTPAFCESLLKPMKKGDQTGGAVLSCTRN